jgi:hypothetical protein
MIYKKLHDELYGADLMFFSGCSIEEAQKKANRVFNIQEELSVEKSDSAAFFVCTTKEGKTCYIIWVRRSRDYPTIAHEVVHLVFDVFKDRGIPNSYQNQEAFAYYSAFWLENLLKSRRKLVHKKKK